MLRHFTPSRARRACATVASAAIFGSLAMAGTAGAAPVIERNFAAPTPNADADPFYTPPAVIPAGEPGDIIRARKSKAGPPTARNLAEAWQVMYLSTDATGARTVVTGTIMVPKGKDPATVPVVGFAPGTTGPAFQCTVSRFINSGSFYEQPAVNGMLKAGYAVATTDYAGYYENPNTTYIVGRSMGPAVLDMVRAATRLPDAKLAAKPKVMFRGYSQGGGASMWAGELAPSYAPELDVIGIAAGGVPADLPSVAVPLDGSPAFGFFLNALIGLDNAYPELDLENYLNPAGVDAVAKMEKSDCTLELLTSYSGKTAEDYTTDAPFLAPAWLKRLTEENVLAKTPPKVPVFQYHGTNDTIVNPGQARKLKDAYCKAGVNLTWQTYPVGHVTGVARGNEDALAYMAARVAGVPATSNC